MSVVDGNITGDLAEKTIRLDGASSTAAPITVTQGGNTANVAIPDPNLGAGLVVSTGSLIASTTLNAVAAGTGSTVDFGSGKANITLAIRTSAGVSAGAVALEVSQDNSVWFRGTPVTTGTASTTFQTNQGGAWRYARGVVTTNITGGTVSATLMAS